MHHILRSTVNCLNVQKSTCSSRLLHLAGVFPPVTTPFDQDGNILNDKFHENIQLWEKIRFTGYVVQGTTGEYTHMSSEERVEQVRQIKKSVSPNKTIIAGAGCDGTLETIRMGCKMADAGADALLIVTPNYFKGKMTAQALKRHYTSVADSVPVPVILYSVPHCTALDLDPDVAIQLADHPNIHGMKESGGNIAKIGRLVSETKDKNFSVLAGSAGFLLATLIMGGTGGVCGLANVLGQQVVDLYDLHKKGQHEKSLELQRRLINPNAMVTTVYGTAGNKAAMEWFGFYGGPPRLPLLPLTTEELKKMKNVFVKHRFL